MLTQGGHACPVKLSGTPTPGHAAAARLTIAPRNLARDLEPSFVIVCPICTTCPSRETSYMLNPVFIYASLTHCALHKYTCLARRASKQNPHARVRAGYLD
jgi:hypothetical protein